MRNRDILCAFWVGVGLLAGSGCLVLPSTNRKTLPDRPLSAEQQQIKTQLARDVQMLADTIGQRNFMHPTGLEQAARYITQQFEQSGYAVQRQTYTATAPGGAKFRGYQYDTIEHTSSNLIAELRGTDKPDEILIVGAHYDTPPLPGCRGANDNASGVAVLLALARGMAKTPASRTIRFVTFTNEEPPHFMTRHMGSLVHARASSREGQNVIAMISVDSVGCYRDTPNSQRQPAGTGWFLPTTGNYINFVSTDLPRNSALVRKSLDVFRNHSELPAAGAAVPLSIGAVGLSDHWSFWQVNIPAMQITDTGPFRYPHNHQPTDTPEKLDYPNLARLAEGLLPVLQTLATPDE